MLSASRFTKLFYVVGAKT